MQSCSIVVPFCRSSEILYSVVFTPRLIVFARYLLCLEIYTKTIADIAKWMDEYETTAKFNIAETCVASISLEQLKELSEDKSSEIWDPSTVLTYGPIRGSEKLRCTLANLYSSKASSPFQSEHVLITPGAIAANYNVFYGLIGEGDHVICHYPTYQQLYDVPASLGAEVSLWRAQEDNKWQLDGEELKSLVRPNTKMIVIK